MKHLESIKWYNKGKFERDETNLEDGKKDLNFICIGNISNLYLYEEQIDEKTFILYDNYKYVFNDYSPYYPNDEQIEEIIKSKRSIGIYKLDNSKTWSSYQWSNLPEELKDRIVI